MKRIFIIAAALFATLAHGEVKMGVFIAGRRAGTATLSQRILANGGKIVDLGMVIDAGGNEVTVRSETTYDAKGASTRKFQQTWTKGKHDRREIIAGFDGDGANAVIEVNGERTTKHVSLVANAPREDSSEFWFIRSVPAIATTVSSFRFNLDTLSWDLVNTVYKGMRPVTIDGKRVMAHVTESEQGTAFLDKDGLPLRLELEGAVLERIWEKS
jgi:hypothetical protein